MKLVVFYFFTLFSCCFLFFAKAESVDFAGNLVNIFGIFDQENLNNFIDFFIYHVFDTPLCGLNSSFNVNEKNYSFYLQIKNNTSSSVNKYQKISTTIPIANLKNLDMNVTEYFQNIFESSFSDYSEDEYILEISKEMEIIFNDSKIDDNLQFNVIFVDDYYEWLNDLPPLNGKNRNLDVFLFNDSTLFESEEYYRNKFYKQFEKVDHSLISLNFENSDHEYENFGLCQDEIIPKVLELIPLPKTGAEADINISLAIFRVLAYICIGIAFLIIVCLCIRCCCCCCPRKKDDILIYIKKKKDITPEKRKMLSEAVEELYLHRRNLQISFRHELGRGVSSIVYPGNIFGKSPLLKKYQSLTMMTHFHDCQVAVKIPFSFKGEEMEAIIAEISQQKKLKQHKNICTLLGWSLYGSQICLLYEPMEQDLLSYVKSLRIPVVEVVDEKSLKNSEDSKLWESSNSIIPEFDEKQKKIFMQIIWQAIVALQYIASKNVIHRDVAARNFLLSKEGDSFAVKLADFGLSCNADETTKVYNSSFEKRLPIKWLSIEALVDKVFSEASDIWAFGLTLIEIFTCGEELYPGIRMNQMTEYLSSGKRIEKPKNMDDEIYEIAFSCWYESPEKRPTFESLEKTFYQMILDTDSGYYLSLIKHIYTNM